ncbi:tail protein (tape measure) [Pantoea wallisii]|uniref:Tail protein (Tape measure) n=1 Tax=Pantoea wallisii TaxID=1076551 RepID=A0A1X1D6T2_9GAMM|nr:phage tail length tape measure family protein [Pantoea wallisii]ORM72364.1 tail protein (tape measure) [Pantoea wallisii]
MAEKVGEIYYEVGADVAQLISSAKSVESALSGMAGDAKATGKAIDSLGREAKSTSSNLDQITSHAKSMDSSMQTLNTSVTAVAAAIAQSNTNSTAASMTLTQMNAAMQTLISSVNSMATAIQSAGNSTKGASNEFSRAETIIEGLGNQIAILDEAQENGARSAAVLAAQLRAGSSATEEEKKKIGDLTGQLFDMRNSTDQGAKSSGAWRSQMQQAGYQVQDFIVQVQGGQSALVAFSQQGSQLAGAFGPSGAIVGAVIALSTVLAGTLIAALNGGKNAMDALKDAAASMDKVITVSQTGVAALSNQYANLARTNSQLATVMRTQVLLEYNQAMAKVGKSIGDTSSQFFSFGDVAKAALSGGSASVKLLTTTLDAAGIKTDNFKEAFDQLSKSSVNNQATMSTFINTVGALSSKLGISDQEAFKLAKQLADLSKNPSPQALQDLAVKLQSMTSSTKEGQQAIIELLGPIVSLSREAANAAFNVDLLKKNTDNLTDGQKNLIRQSERNLALSKLQGEARARLQEQYAAEDAGFAKDDPHVKKMQDDAAATYRNTEAQKKLKSEQQKGATQAESIAQKLANLKQQAELAADSTTEMSRAQAVLQAQMSLGKGATQEQIGLAGKYRGEIWDTANALKAQAAAEKLLPEARENASYKQDVQDLNTALSAKKISQQQYNSTMERLEEEHQVNLAKIRANQVVSPQQEALGTIDPVQALANENAQKLALIQQFETQKGQITQRGLDLMNASNTQYEQQRIAAQWQILSQQSLSYDMLTSAVDAFAGNASNALTGLLTGTMSVDDALRSLGNTILNSVINSIVQMGVEYAKNLIIQQTLGTAAVAATSAQALAAAAAWATPAALAATATSGGAAVAGNAALATTVGSAQAMALAGARKNGGPVSAGSMYQVGESGLPEIYQASTGKQYMIPGDNGKVISNKDMQSGGGGVVINIQNYTSASVDAQAGNDGNGGLTVDVIVADLNNGGPISSGITSNFNVKRTPRGQS